MISMMDPHKAVMTIMKRRKSGLMEPMKNELPTKEEDGNIDPRHLAAEDVMMAIKSQSPHHLMQALSNFHDMHLMHKEKEEQMGPRDEDDMSNESDRAES